ncbi:SDR family NAD(P)-dependent oxidoreductase [Hymenobacter terrenus]|uniref:SDR family NAD(P)-dependent oxidoreductase n=1 Tax=Hymenobacter terrenus TaxID=1629124 RepID=UPI00069603E2|nr:SDR family NAD(P)-dependent oxidoreductase [Hymenobacter terrenus]
MDVVNIASGLGFIRRAVTLVYSATEAALHSYTQALRHHLRDTAVHVFEVAPPSVDTAMNASSSTQEKRPYVGIAPAEFATAALQALRENHLMAPIGLTAELHQASRGDKATFVFGQLNAC